MYMFNIQSEVILLDMQKKYNWFWDYVRTPPPVEGGGQRPKNFTSPKFLKKNSKWYTTVKTINPQKFFDSETMTSGKGGKGVPPLSSRGGTPP